ncbi:hypothetical protein ABW19_dt0209388 [Dactylella cylindrospora]|nr:hypothetical protein ABW19_dt0209388 [Dactylella cylindrospora]
MRFYLLLLHHRKHCLRPDTPPAPRSKLKCCDHLPSDRVIPNDLQKGNCLGHRDLLPPEPHLQLGMVYGVRHLPKGAACLHQRTQILGNLYRSPDGGIDDGKGGMGFIIDGLEGNDFTDVE